MKHILYLNIILGLISLSFTQNNTEAIRTENKKDKDEIQKLIRQVLCWSDTLHNIDFLPVIPDNRNNKYVGFDMIKHNENLEIFKQTNFFSSEFIENYNKIILTLDKKFRNGKFEDWFVGEMPPFNFFSDVNPWCLCQDIPYDDPNPFILVEIVKSDSGKYEWKWGNLKQNVAEDWKEFRYKFNVCKENGKWKISYLQGFDYEEVTQ